MLVGGKERDYLTYIYKGLGSDISAFSEKDIDEYVRCYTNSGALTADFNQYRAFSQDEQDNQVFIQSKLTMPVMALGGELTTGPFLVYMTQELAENVTGESISDTGHWIPEERPTYLI